MKQKFKIIFMGTPDFGIPSLNMLIKEGYEIAACVTQPDRRAGRGHKVCPPPIKICADTHCIPVYQFDKVGGSDGTALIKDLKPDFLVTAAFGHILTEEVLNIPKYGCINVHASLLPKYRGAAPIQWALINGEEKTGITTMMTVKALDAGNILEQDEISIYPKMTAGELYYKLSVLGAETLKRTLARMSYGDFSSVPQDEAEASYYPMFKKDFWEVDFNNKCESIINFIRAADPAPGAFMRYNGEPIKIYDADVSDFTVKAEPGKIVSADEKSGLLIQAGDGVLSIGKIKRSGAKLMDSKDSLRGKKIDLDYCFTRT